MPNTTEKRLDPVSEEQVVKINDTVKLRQSTKNPKHSLNEICCQIPVKYDSKSFGYHRWCYQNFTNISKITKQAPDDENVCTTQTTKQTNWKTNLKPHFEQKLRFWGPNYESDLVYTDDVQVGKAVEVAFEYAC